VNAPAHHQARRNSHSSSRSWICSGGPASIVVSKTLKGSAGRVLRRLQARIPRHACARGASGRTPAADGPDRSAARQRARGAGPSGWVTPAASAPPRPHAVSVCSRSSRLSSGGSLPVVVAAWLISASAAPGTAVAPDHRRGLDVRHQLADLRRRRLIIQPPLRPSVQHLGPVRPVGARVTALTDAETTGT
jgi:hypothetical protein